MLAPVSGQNYTCSKVWDRSSVETQSGDPCGQQKEIPLKYTFQNMATDIGNRRAQLQSAQLNNLLLIVGNQSRTIHQRVREAA